MPSKNLVTVGIFGGMGSIAGSHFYHLLTKAFIGKSEQMQPNVILLSDPSIPRRDKSVLEALEQKEPTIFIDKVLEKLAVFKSYHVDFVVVPCNTFHYFHSFLIEQSGVKILNMIDIVSQYTLKNHNLNKIGLLSTRATAKAKLYQNAFAENQISVVLPDKKTQLSVDFIIEQVKIGQSSAPVTRDALKEAIHYMSEMGVSTTILGCTELPVAAHYDRHPMAFVDTTAALVEGTVAEITKIMDQKSAHQSSLFASLHANIDPNTPKKPQSTL